MRSLRLLYLMEDTDLSGGVRVQLAQADALIARGHEVTIATRGLPLTWRRSEARWLHVNEFSEVPADDYDFVIGTFWTTVPQAWALAGERAVHLCQGYEGSFSYYQNVRESIEAVYALPIPKLVVARSLVEICQRFHSDVSFIGQIVDEELFRTVAPPVSEPLRVLLPGASQIDIKGISEGYGAVLHARYLGAQFQLVRVSPWKPSGEEPLGPLEAEFHTALTAAEMTRLIHSCDILVAPNRKEEGFGLPAAEAMAAAIPTVLTRIPSYLSFAERHDYALFADEDDAVGLGDHLAALVEDDELRRRIGRRGREVAEQFRAPMVAERIEELLMGRVR